MRKRIDYVLPRDRTVSTRQIRRMLFKIGQPSLVYREDYQNWMFYIGDEVYHFEGDPL